MEENYRFYIEGKKVVTRFVNYPVRIPGGLVTKNEGSGSQGCLPSPSFFFLFGFAYYFSSLFKTLLVTDT